MKAVRCLKALFNIGICFSYKCWFDDVWINWIWTKWCVRSRDRWKGLIISFDSILRSILGRWVSCHKFHRVSGDLIKSLGVVLPRPIVWMLLLVDCGGCWIGVVLPPFHQTGLRPFLASYRLYTYSRAYAILNYIRRLVFKYFWGLVLKMCGLMLKGWGWNDLSSLMLSFSKIECETICLL